MELLIHSQTSAVPPLKFGNGSVNFTPQFIMNVITYPWVIVNQCWWKGPKVSIYSVLLDINCPQWTVHITVTSKWARWRLKSPAASLSTQPFIQAQITENINDPRHWPLCREYTGDWWIPSTNDQLSGKCFHLMTSSWTLRNPRKCLITVSMYRSEHPWGWRY